MARLFISHSSADNAAAVALGAWLSQNGFDDVFLDVDPDHGLALGERWQVALKSAADRCEAVLFLVSPAWVASKWCLTEFLLAKMLHKRVFGLMIGNIAIDQLPKEMTAEWQLCNLTADGPASAFDVEVNGSRARVEFSDAGLNLLRRGLDRAGLDPRSFVWPPPDEPNRAPYRGLRALEPKDAAIFFGRDAAIIRGLDCIRGLATDGVERLLVILGASGAGKSSFMRAGLWPRLERDDINFLPLPVVRPETAAITGSSGLDACLVGAFEHLGAARSAGEIKECLAKGPQGFAQLLDDLLSMSKRRFVGSKEDKVDPTILLAIDQAEELFNVDGAAEAARMLELIAGVLTLASERQRRFLVVITIRSDRYQLLQSEEHLISVKQALFNLPPISSSEFKTIIEGPARRAVNAGGRLTLDPALIERLIADAQGTDALPLLAFTLERLFADYGSQGKLTLVEYEKMGGLQGSLEAAVQNALARADRAPAIPAGREAQLALLRAAFIPWLARIDPASGLPMRRVARLDEIPEGSRAVVERLVEARLLIADRRDGVDVREVAHESLLRRWTALTNWLEDDAQDLKALEAIDRAAEEWDRNGRLDAWLDHRAERLQAAERVAARPEFAGRLGSAGTAYLQACRARENKENNAVARRRKVLIASLSVATIVFAGIATFSMVSWRIAQNNLKAARGAISSLIEVTSEAVQPIAQLDQVRSLVDQLRSSIDMAASITRDPAIVVQNARTLLILAEIDWDRGDTPQMRSQAERALSDLTPIAQSGDLEARYLKARAQRLIGLSFWEAYKNEEARDTYVKAIADLRGILKEHPDDKSRWLWERSLADLEQELGDVLLVRFMQPQQALAEFQACLEARLRVKELGHEGPAFDADIAWAHNKLGDAQLRLSGDEAAMKWFATARNDFNGLGFHLWNNVLWPHRLGLIYNNIGLIQVRHQKLEEADASFENAERLLTEVVRRDSKNLFRQSALAWTQNNRGEVLVRLAMAKQDPAVLDTAQRTLSSALDLRQKIVKGSTERVDWDLAIIDTRANLAAVDATRKQLLNEHTTAAQGFGRAAHIILDEYPSKDLRFNAVTRSVEFLDWSGLQYELAGNRDEARKQFSTALGLVNAQASVLGDTFTLLKQRLDQHLQNVGQQVH